MDDSTKNWSLFNCIEEVQVPLLGVPYPFEVVTFWKLALNEMNRAFKIKLLVKNKEGDVAAETGDLPSVVSDKKRHRVRLLGFPSPKVPGEYMAQMAWRWNDKESWTEESAHWGIEFTLLYGPPQ